MTATAHRNIPFSCSFVPPEASIYLSDAIAGRQLSSAGRYTAWCESFLAQNTSAARVLLTNSGTAALEMACMLIGLGPGDEVIVPAFTFPSTASAVVRTGATPVFVDIEPNALGLDVQQVAAAITASTQAIIPVHYAGVPCDIDGLNKLVATRGIRLIEDAAHAFDASFAERKLGTLGTFGAYSFQQTKNLSCGEGGALIVNADSYIEAAQVARDKGTNRWEVAKGLRDSYHWAGLGAGCVISELSAAYLRAQFEHAREIKDRRLALWNRYRAGLLSLADKGAVKIPGVGADVDHNGHIFFVVMKNKEARSKFIDFLARHGVTACFHYVPLHSSPAGRRYGRVVGSCAVTDHVADGLVRLPLFHELALEDVDHICELAHDFFRRAH